MFWAYWWRECFLFNIFKYIRLYITLAVTMMKYSDSILPVFDWPHVSIFASEISDNLTVWPTACSGQQHRKQESCTSLALSEGNPAVTGGFPTTGFPSQTASNAEIIYSETISMSWRHHHALHLPHCGGWAWTPPSYLCLISVLSRCYLTSNTWSAEKEHEIVANKWAWVATSLL